MKIPEFKNKQIWLTALTHRSALNEKVSSALESNERLEYLGDAVLELVVTEFLYQKMPEASEGTLTAIRSALVKTTTLCEVGKDLALGEQLYLSKGEEGGGGRENCALIADTLEAVIGGLYLDQGIEVVKSFITEVILSKFEQVVESGLYRDAKSTLQEEVQALGYNTPNYQVLKAEGPDHDKIFTIAVVVEGKRLGVGVGKSKQIAQQQAASQALKLVEEGKFLKKNH